MNDQDALTNLLASWQAPEPAVKAQELLTWLRSRGWHKFESSVPPAAPRPANPEQVAARIAEARAAIHGKDQT